MAREYALRLEKYGISREQYQELKWFCRQYPQKVAELNAIRGGFNSFGIRDGPGSGRPGDPTGEGAMRAAVLEAETKAVEQAAIAADAELYAYIIRNVVRGIRFELLDAPCNKNRFTAARAQFYVRLAVLRGKIVELGAINL